MLRWRQNSYAREDGRPRWNLALMIETGWCWPRNPQEAMKIWKMSSLRWKISQRNLMEYTTVTVVRPTKISPNRCNTGSGEFKRAFFACNASAEERLLPRFGINLEPELARHPAYIFYLRRFDGKAIQDAAGRRVL